MKRIKLIRNVPFHCISNYSLDIIRWIDDANYKILMDAHKAQKPCDISLYLQNTKFEPEIYHNLDTSEFLAIVEMPN